MPKFFMNNFQIRELLNLLLGGSTENGKILLMLIEINLSIHNKTQLGNGPHPPIKKFLEVVHPVTQLVLCGIWSTACSITYILQP